MKIAVIGPGALGCLFAGRMMQAGLAVELVDHRPDRVARLQATGVTITDKSGQTALRIPVVSSVSDDATLQLVAVKSQHTKDLSLATGIPCLSIQNGLGNIETLCNMLGGDKVLCGTTSEAATLETEGVVRHAAAGETIVGSWTTCDPAVATEPLLAAGFTVETTESPGQMLWKKVVTNAAINPLTAIVDCPNGRLVEVPELRALLRTLVVEAVKVAGTEGYRFDESLVEHTEEVCRRTATNISSMLQDIRAGRPTEIEAISGEILRRAELAMLPSPRTRVVYQLVKGMEQK